MSFTEETIEATLDPSGQLQLAHQPSLPPGPVQVTIRVAVAGPPQRGLADVVREISAEQRSRGFPGRSTTEVNDDVSRDDDAERDLELDAARRGTAPGVQ